MAAGARIAAQAGQAAGKLLQNKWFWIILGAVILLVIVNRKWDKFMTKTRGRLGRQEGDWQPASITEGRKVTIESMAKDLQRSLDNFWEWESSSEIEALLALNDNELEYAARYFEDVLTRGEQSMYEAVEEERLFGTNSDDQLEARLMALGLT